MNLRCSFCSLLLIAGGLHAQINLDSGLVAHWELDGNALDSGPGLYHGTPHGPLAADDRFGNPNSAYLFNGASDFVALPPVFSTPPTAVTFSAWFKIPIDQPEGKLIHHGQHGEFQMFTDTNTLFVAVHLGTDLPTGWVLASQKFVDDFWHFAAGRYEEGQFLDLYFDGQIAATTALPALSMMDPGPNFQAALGKYRYNNIQHYGGLLDDVRIYDRALSNAELDSLAGGMFSTAVAERPAPGGLELLQNQPNPASGRTTLSYRLPVPGPVSLRLHDLHGRLVSELEHGTRAAGMHTCTVDLGNVGPGVYFYTLRSAGSVLTRKLVVE